ncbi:unnamed protein product [Fraxinus pennsylvanica]|uniref:Organ-specific protein S2 n=1 Tax=Fraxinus pennsylvanica TaxID=56036 RepID=A0AAD1ZHG9_9LAMI|nr:unnamed protein product [Fraxinus pennsylvanica]
MKLTVALLGIFCLAVLATTIDARKEPEEYWQGVMKDLPMPEAIQGLLDTNSVEYVPSIKRDCHTSTEASKQDKPFVQDFEPRPSTTTYRDDKLKNEISFAKDLEPRPSATAYRDDKLKNERSFTKDFEPRPTICKTAKQRRDKGS